MILITLLGFDGGFGKVDVRKETEGEIVGEKVEGLKGDWFTRM